jgi:hypothetical protein
MFAYAAAAVAAAASCSMAQLRVAQWNITNWNGSSDHTRDAAFKTAIYGTVPSGLLAGQQMAPDVLIAEEIVQSGTPIYPETPADMEFHRQVGQTNVDAFLAVLNTAPGSPGDWLAAPYVANQGDTGNALFYRSSQAFLVSPIITLGTHGVDVCGAANTSGSPYACGDQTNQSPRDNQRWQLRPHGYTGAGAGADLYLYGGHFKSGSASSDQIRRIPEANRIRANANSLPAGANFLVGADFNVQTSTQTFYATLIGTPATGRFFDPIIRPGSWENSPTYHNIHTQEPASQMDSRHDQILISGSLRDGQGMDYLPATTSGNILVAFNSTAAGSGTTWYDANHSYRCWGNDGESYNTLLRTTTNSQVGPAIAQALITSVAGNGHLGVYLDVKVPARLGAPSGTIDLGTVAQNSTTTYGLGISNAADFVRFSKDGTGWGIDGLSYSLAISSSSFSIPSGLGPFEAPATNPTTVYTHSVTLDTTTPGSKSATITITSDDPDNPTRVITLLANVQSVAQTGACCSTTTGACSLVLQTACTSPNVWSVANSCTSPNPCPQPGACCSPSTGQCTLVLQSSCSSPSAWAGAASCNAPNPCPQPGACCANSSGACSLVLQSTCTGPNTWNGAASCAAPNPCSQPTGACCVNTVCSSSTQSACTGAFQGAGVACSPPDNPVICCYANFDRFGGLAISDIFTYLNAWFGGSPFADTNHSGQLEIQDIFDFLSLWFAGC